LSQPADPSYVIGATLMVALMLAGLWLLWRLVVSPAARARREPPALSPWPGTASDLLLFFLLAMGGAIFVPSVAALALRHSGLSPGAMKVASLATFQGGMLAGIAVYYLGFKGQRAGGEPARHGIWLSGLVTVLIALPLVQGVAVVWQALLGACGLPVETPDNVQIFMDLPTPTLRILFALLAIGVVPVAEELVFRAALFRYFLGRFPRWVALLVPALIFGAMHLMSAPLESLSSFAPLVMLGVVLSVAYQRTGRIGTAAVAHGLFNLLTVVLVQLGVNT
jgi:membrane protease YdiL (CAAX protease family)